ncbi:MAG: hypothetical protein HZA62_12040 [Rhodocyclales bacterium]|nr:hypothetical protein [Rhodocyclales bacterium]
MDATPTSKFQRLYTGRLWSVLDWNQLTAFWQRIDPAAGWYIVAPGVPRAPTSPSSQVDAATVANFIDRIDTLLRAEHRESYCGIVYANDLENPLLIKIFDPNNLGSSCGSSKNPPGPGWIMSRLPPEGLEAARPAPAGRQRWWRELFPDS